MMTTTGGDGPSVFAKYINGPEKARPSPLENLIKQSRRHADLKTFLMDILIGGPVPVTLIVERGTAHGFTEKQLRYAREQMNIVAFKETGRPHGCWLWALPHDNRSARRSRQRPPRTFNPPPQRANNNMHTKKAKKAKEAEDDPSSAPSGRMRCSAINHGTSGRRKTLPTSLLERVGTFFRYYAAA